MQRYLEEFPCVVESGYTGMKLKLVKDGSGEVVEVRSREASKGGGDMIAILQVGQAKRIISYGKLPYAKNNLAGQQNRARRAEYLQNAWDEGQTLNSDTPKVKKRASPMPRASTALEPAAGGLAEAMPALGNPRRDARLDACLAFADNLNKDSTLKAMWNKLAPRLVSRG